MAVMYSKLGGCLGDTTKLDPLAGTDLCAWVKGMLDRLMTHLGLGSSMEDPWGGPYWGRGTFPGTGTTCLRSSAVPLGSLRALYLAEHLTACLPAWVGNKPIRGLFPVWERPSPEVMLLEEALASWEVVLSPARGVLACLPA